MRARTAGAPLRLRMAATVPGASPVAAATARSDCCGSCRSRRSAATVRSANEVVAGGDHPKWTGLSSKSTPSVICSAESDRHGVTEEVRGIVATLDLLQARIVAL